MEITMVDFLLPGELQPYVHYVPVREVLADLTEKPAWAEANPIEAKKMSRAGTAFVVKLPQMVEQLLNKYVRDRTGAVMERYRHNGNLSLVESYIAAGRGGVNGPNIDRAGKGVYADIGKYYILHTRNKEL